MVETVDANITSRFLFFEQLLRALPVSLDVMEALISTIFGKPQE
jgi:hypothetical protein